MIPKILHFCWFGGNAYPDDIQDCMKTWDKVLSDYQVMRWDEKNFNVHGNRYAEQAYEKGKWAFVSDYARLWALYHYGGIYLDCDVRVIKRLDRFLVHAFFSGYENKANPGYIPTGIIGAEKSHPFIKYLLDDYEDRVFIKTDGSFDLTTNVVRITEAAERSYGFIGDGRYQVFGEDIHIYPYDYFSGFRGGLNGEKTLYDITENTHTIHEFAGSWYPRHRQIYRKIKKLWPVVERIEKAVRQFGWIERVIRRI